MTSRGLFILAVIALLVWVIGRTLLVRSASSEEWVHPDSAMEWIFFAAGSDDIQVQLWSENRPGHNWEPFSGLERSDACVEAAVLQGTRKNLLYNAGPSMNVRFAPKATEIPRCRGMTRCAFGCWIFYRRSSYCCGSCCCGC
jgi:hypothetical protein